MLEGLSVWISNVGSQFFKMYNSVIIHLLCTVLKCNVGSLFIDLCLM
jgi:hypothetical protein